MHWIGKLIWVSAGALFQVVGILAVIVFGVLPQRLEPLAAVYLTLGLLAAVSSYVMASFPPWAKQSPPRATVTPPRT